MIFTKTPIPGCFLVDLEKRGDDRGFFARFFCEREFAAQGIVMRSVQINTSVSAHKGTLRGMHYQLPPSEEVKVVRCILGRLYDVVLDLRRDSPTYRRHFAAELTPQNRSMMVVPRGCAHGFLTLEDNTEALYLVSAYYDSSAERGVRWNDPAFAILWPSEPAVLSPKDSAIPDYTL